MLGDVSLPKVEQIFQMADTSLPRSNPQQNLDADWGTGSFENVTDGLIRRFNRIRYHEYIIFVIFIKKNMTNITSLECVFHLNVNSDDLFLRRELYTVDCHTL